MVVKVKLITQDRAACGFRVAGLWKHDGSQTPNTEIEDDRAKTVEALALKSLTSNKNPGICTAFMRAPPGF